jgi:2-desacetyl-2-hydroxyethyl bacteriochlorophyllide A dehydrogenase
MPQSETIVFPEPNRVTVEERTVEQSAEDEVLVRTDRTLISTGTELTVLSGEYPPGSQWDNFQFPFEPGYNNVGTVVETGAAVTNLSEGDRVATYGPHSEYVVVAADACRPIPDAVDDEAAVFFTIAEIVMNGVRRSRLTWGETVTVYGLGLLGQLAVRCCHAAGARPVVGVDAAAKRVSYLPNASNIEGVHVGTRDPVEEVEAVTGGTLADVVFELTGNPDVIPTEFDVLRDQGRFVILSSPKGATEFDFHDLCNAPSYEIIGAHNSSHPSTATSANPWTQQRHAELFFEYLADGTMAVDSLVSHKKSYADAPEVYDHLQEDRSQALGVVLEW